MNRTAFALTLVATAATWLVCDLARSGDMAQGGDDPRARVEDLRRERQGTREWITVPEMDRDTLLGLLGDPAVAILDVTCKKRGAAISERIPGAVWRDCTQVERWAGEFQKEQTIVVYCA